MDSASLVADSKAITNALSKKEKVVLFLTLQDLQGEEIKEKHKDVFNNDIDLLIVDETHYGARGEEYGRILRNSRLSKRQMSHEMEACETSDRFDEDIKGLNYKIQLHLLVLHIEY